MSQLKDNIRIHGLDNEIDIEYCELLDAMSVSGVKDYVYKGKTSDIPEDIAKECVEVTATGLFKNYIWSNEKVQDYGMQPISTTAKGSIQSAVTKEDGSFYDYIIIFKDKKV